MVLSLSPSSVLVLHHSGGRDPFHPTRVAAIPHLASPQTGVYLLPGYILSNGVRWLR